MIQLSDLLNHVIWFNLSDPGLTSQRHSALINSDSEYFQVCFSAVHYLKISEQRWFSSEQRWKRKFSELKISALSALIFSETALIQSWTAPISSETALNSADFWIIQNDNCWFIFHYVQNFSKLLNFETHNSGFQPILRNEVSNKNLLLHFRTGLKKFINLSTYYPYITPLIYWNLNNYKASTM